MPGGDSTGPMGTGPRTGRGAGLCAETGMRGYARRGLGRGMGGRGFGRGWGRGARFNASRQNPLISQPDPNDERQMLEQEAAYLKNQVEQIQNRLNELGESR